MQGPEESTVIQGLARTGGSTQATLRQLWALMDTESLAGMAAVTCNSASSASGIFPTPFALGS